MFGTLHHASFPYSELKVSPRSPKVRSPGQLKWPNFRKTSYTRRNRTDWMTRNLQGLIRVTDDAKYIHINSGYLYLTKVKSGQYRDIIISQWGKPIWLGFAPKPFSAFIACKSVCFLSIQLDRCTDGIYNCHWRSCQVVWGDQLMCVEITLGLGKVFSAQSRKQVKCVWFVYMNRWQHELSWFIGRVLTRETISLQS